MFIVTTIFLIIAGDETFNITMCDREKEEGE